MNPYLHFEGNARDAMNFYRSILGGEFSSVQRYKDLPGAEKMAEEDQENLIHIALDISPTLTIMASDSPSAEGPGLYPGNNLHICLHTDSEAETERIFHGLSKQGQVEMPLNKTFWGSYFGMCRDKFGIQWMVNYAAI